MVSHQFDFFISDTFWLFSLFFLILFLFVIYGSSCGVPILSKEYLPSSFSWYSSILNVVSLSFWWTLWIQTKLSHQIKWEFLLLYWLKLWSILIDLQIFRVVNPFVSSLNWLFNDLLTWVCLRFKLFNDLLTRVCSRYRLLYNQLT